MGIDDVILGGDLPWILGCGYHYIYTNWIWKFPIPYLKIKKLFFMIYPTSKFLTRLNKIILPLRIQRGKSFKILRLLKICRFGRCVYFAPAGAASPPIVCVLGGEWERRTSSLRRGLCLHSIALLSICHDQYTLQAPWDCGNPTIVLILIIFDFQTGLAIPRRTSPTLPIWYYNLIESKIVDSM